MGDNISFSIQNPNAQPINAPDLFLSEDSTLIFVFEFPAELGITQLSQGDLFSIIIPDTLLSTALAGNLADPDWAVQSLILPSSNDPNYTFVLTPQSSIQVNGTVDITFKKLQGKALGQAEVNTHYNIDGTPLSGSSEKLFVLTAPNGQLKDLNDDVDFTAFINYDQQLVAHDLVYISPQNLQPPIANRIHLNLAYNGHDNLIPNWPPLSPPQFIISFSYGTGSNDLTEAIRSGHPGYNALTSAWSIKAAIDQAENPAWNLPLPNTADPSPSWVVEPSIGNQHLLTHDQNLDVIFDQIISILPEGVAHLYVQWDNIPGYNAGVRAVALNKQAPQQAKLDFSSPQDGQTILWNTPVTLNWQAFAAENLKITWDSGFRSKPLTAYDANHPQLIYAGSDDTIVPDSPESQFLLNANFDPGTGAGGVKSNAIGVTVSNFPAPSIQQFSAELQKDASGNLSMVLNWLVENLGDEGYFMLNGERIDGIGFNGLPCTQAIPVSPSIPFEDTYTLEAIGSGNSSQTLVATIPDWFAPEVSQFSGSISRDQQGQNPTLQLSWQVQNLTKETITCQLNGVEYPLDGEGKGNASIPLIPVLPPSQGLGTTPAPLLSAYTLRVKNLHGATPGTKTIQANFQKSGVLPVPDRFRSNGGQYTPAALALMNKWIDNGSTCLVFNRIPQNTGQDSLYFTIDQFDAFQLVDRGPVNWQIFAGRWSFSAPSGSIKMSVSPDGTQLYINLPEADWGLYCIVNYGQESIFGRLYEGVSCSAVAPNMQIMFLGTRNDSYIVYGRPDYRPYSPNSPNEQDEGPILNGVYLDQRATNNPVAIAISPDSKRSFIASSPQGKVFYADAMWSGQPVTNYLADYTQIQNLIMSNNGWLYMLGAADNKPDCLVYALQTANGNTGATEATPVGNIYDQVPIVVSADNSFVLISNAHDNQLYVMTGATDTKPSVTLLQSIPLTAPGDVVIMPDNTRLFVIVGNEVQVFDAVFV